MTVDDPAAERWLGRTVTLTDALVDHLMSVPVLPWMWGPGLLGHALGRLQDRLGDRRYDPYLIRFCRHHTDAAVHSSDTAAPALVAFDLQQHGNDEFSHLVDRALGYLAGAPQVGGVPDHLGTSGYSHLYPSSAWVDTVMMAGVFPALVGAARHDQEMLDRAARLPVGLADLLLDERTGLWSHSYWAPAWHSPHGRRFPSRVFWARGNGWVVAALPTILAQVGADHPQAPAIRQLLERTSVAMAERQRPDGTWHTVLDGPVHGYRELSASALVAAGWLDAVHLGVLPADYADRARLALHTVVGAIREGHHGPELPEISGPTIPGPVFPRLGYLLVPRRPNLTWGVAALVQAVLAADDSSAPTP